MGKLAVEFEEGTVTGVTRVVLSNAETVGVDTGAVLLRKGWGALL